VATSSRSITIEMGKRRRAMLVTMAREANRAVVYWLRRGDARNAVAAARRRADYMAQARA
jgi:hypothetical protein